MTTETILTDEQIMICLVSLYQNHQSAGMGELRVMSDMVPIGRAIEQAVLQSPEIQALRKDAQRYREIRKMSLRQFSEIYQANLQTGVPFDLLVDAAMEKQP